MAYAQIGNYRFRIPPSQVFFTYDIDSVVIPTVGGRVVQVYGVTVGDITVQGLFGQQRNAGGRDSWELAEEFQAVIAGMVEQQGRIPTALQMQGRDPGAGQMHEPFRFVFDDNDDARRARGEPIHHWDFMVYIKDLKDVAASDWTVEHATGKYSYGYTLTLFLVSDNSRQLHDALVTSFIERLATGVGWKRTRWNGPMDIAELKEYLAANSPDGTIHGLVEQQFSDAAEGPYFTPQQGGAINPVAGGAATVAEAQGKLGGQP